MGPTSRIRGFFLIPGCGEESLPIEVVRRKLRSVLSQVVRQAREMRCLAVESCKGKRVMFISDRAILVAAAAGTSLPRMLLCEGTHWSVMSQPSVARWRRVLLIM